MTYTAENIRDIKAAGQLEGYIAHERTIIANLDTAEVIYDAQGEHSASYAHLTGRYGTDFEDGGRNVVVWLSYDRDWERKFPLGSFDNDFDRAFAYAKATLRNKLIKDGKALRASAIARLAALEAA